MARPEGLKDLRLRQLALVHAFRKLWPKARPTDWARLAAGVAAEKETRGPGGEGVAGLGGIELLSRSGVLLYRLTEGGERGFMCVELAVDHDEIAAELEAAPGQVRFVRMRGGEPEPADVARHTVEHLVKLLKRGDATHWHGRLHQRDVEGRARADREVNFIYASHMLIGLMLNAPCYPIMKEFGWALEQIGWRRAVVLRLELISILRHGTDRNYAIATANQLAEAEMLMQAILK